MTLAINQMVDYLLSENGAEIRQQLSVQLVDQVDQLGVDAVTFARKNVGQVRRGEETAVQYLFVISVHFLSTTM